MKGDTNVNEKAALIVGCGGVGSHVAQAIRHKFPNKKLILADYSQPKIAEEMAKRYGKHPGLSAWHVANEYGTYCYCENCQQKFRL